MNKLDTQIALPEGQPDASIDPFGLPEGVMPGHWLNGDSQADSAWPAANETDTAHTARPRRSLRLWARKARLQLKRKRARIRKARLRLEQEERKLAEAERALKRAWRPRWWQARFWG